MRARAHGRRLAENCICAHKAKCAHIAFGLVCPPFYWAVSFFEIFYCGINKILFRWFYFSGRWVIAAAAVLSAIGVLLVLLPQSQCACKRTSYFTRKRQSKTEIESDSENEWSEFVYSVSCLLVCLCAFVCVSVDSHEIALNHTDDLCRESLHSHKNREANTNRRNCKRIK